MSLGKATGQLPLSSLVPHYDALLFAYGASKDRKLGIPGEELKGVYSARDFVGWYNGLPEHATLDFQLDSSEEAVIIGQGNVALDVARMLLSPLERLRETDISEHALDALSRHRVRRVKVVGRRGPLQAPYTIKELRELITLPGVAFQPPDSVSLTDPKKLPRPLKRIAELLQKGSKLNIQEAEKSWELLYMLSPTSFGEDTSRSGALGGVTFGKTEFVKTPDSTEWRLDDLRNLRVQPSSTGGSTSLDTKLAFRSVGYQSEPIDGFQDIGIPFDRKMGIIPNDLYGRVLDHREGPGELTAGHVPGMYCAGWVKRGPTGVIASTMDDAFTSADILAKDWADGVKFNDPDEPKEGWDAVKQEVERRNIRSVSWNDWERIDAEELRRGKTKGKEREKCKSVSEMLHILDS